MNTLDLRKEIEEEEVIEFEECLDNDKWGKTDNQSNDWDIVKILPLGSTTHNYYLAQDSSSSGMMVLYRCKK